MFEWTIPVLELLIDGVVVSAIWQILSHFENKKQEKQLEKQLDNLYDRIVETKEEAENQRR